MSTRSRKRQNTDIDLRPSSSKPVAQVEIIHEEEGQRGWVFRAQVLHDDGGLAQHELTLSWADYNLWSRDGGDEPARVAEAVIAFLVARAGPEALAERFDASLARRRFPDADDAIPRLIER